MANFNKPKSIKKQYLIPNTSEFKNFLLPKYYSALLPVSSFVSQEHSILEAKTWYQKNQLVLNSNFSIKYTKQKPNFYKVSSKLKCNIVWYKANLPLLKSNQYRHSTLTVNLLKNAMKFHQ